MLTVLLGGARSGKSLLAVESAGRLGGSVAFIATAEPLDAELSERIAFHRDQRPAEWETIEEPVHLDAALAATARDAVVIVDCLTLWVANLFGRDLDDAAIITQASQVARRAAARPRQVIVISNEVGSGIVPTGALSRRYRDTLGRVNAVFAAKADAAFLVVAGRVIALSDPLAVTSAKRG